MGESNHWRSPSFRENIVRKLNDHITALEMNVKTDAVQMESNIFQKAVTEHEYLAFIGRLIMYMREKSKTANASRVASSAAIDSNPTALEQELSSFGTKTSDTNSEDNNNNTNGNSFMPATSGSKSANVNASQNHSAPRSFLDSNKRPEPTSSQKLEILRTAIATVLQSPVWRTDDAFTNPKPNLRQFGQYVAVQLAQIEDEATLLATQHKIMSLLNKAV